MKVFLALIFSLFPIFAGADIYKSVDSEGNVVFSDKQTPGAKKILEQLTPTYNSPQLPPAEITTPTAARAVGYYTELRIRKPAQGETLKDAAGMLTIDLEVVPPLKIKEGHILVVTVDSNNLTSHDNTTQLTISNLAPGTHTLKAQIMDATGQVQFSSESITFHMQRTSSASNANTPSNPVR